MIRTFSGKAALCFVAKPQHAHGQLINLLSAIASCVFWQFHSLLRREIKHVSEKHCAVNTDGLELDDAWGKVSFMSHTEHCHEQIQCSVGCFL